MLGNEELRRHRKCMREVKSSVDTSAPACSKLKHMKGNAKAACLAKVRARQIERDNEHLMKRIVGIVEGRAGYTPLVTPAPELPSLESFKARVRNSQLRRIEEENRGLVIRLTKVRSPPREGSHLLHAGDANSAASEGRAVRT